MIRTNGETHKRFCDYEIAKANNNRYIAHFSQRKSSRQKPVVMTGIKTSGKSREVLAMELASLF